MHFTEILFNFSFLWLYSFLIVSMELNVNVLALCLGVFVFVGVKYPSNVFYCMSLTYLTVLPLDVGVFIKE